MSIEIKFLLHPIGSKCDSLTLKGTGCIVACRDVPSPAEFRSRPEGIRKVGVRRSSNGRTFFAREPSRLGTAPPFQCSIRTHVRYSVDGIQPRTDPTNVGGREKLKSHQWAIIVSPVSRAILQKLNNLRGLTSTMSRPLFLSLPLFFPLSSFARRSVGFFSRHCEGFSWTHVSPRPYPETFDEVEQRFVVLHDVYFRQDWDNRKAHNN